MLKNRLLVTAALQIALACQASASIYFETGDAGRLPGTAQDTVGSGSPDEITGTLDSFADIDMFRIAIFDPSAFFAYTVYGVDMVSDPQLFLFDSNGKAVYKSDDGTGFGTQSYLEPGHPLGPVVPGIYYLAISWFGNTPINTLGPVFAASLGISGPDATNGADPVTDWDVGMMLRADAPASYDIVLYGGHAAPEPSSIAMAGVALVVGIGCWKRRRRGH